MSALDSDVWVKAFLATCCGVLVDALKSLRYFSSVAGVSENEEADDGVGADIGRWWCAYYMLIYQKKT